MKFIQDAWRGFYPLFWRIKEHYAAAVHIFVVHKGNIAESAAHCNATRLKIGYNFAVFIEVFGKVEQKQESCKLR